MRLTAEVLELPLEFTFTISRASASVVRTVLLRVHTEYNGTTYTGLGEAVPSEFYGETPESVLQFYQDCTSNGLLQGLTPFCMQALESRFNTIPGNRAAKSGLDEALHDIQGKILNQPLYTLWGLDPTQCPKTSYTIGIADRDTVIHKTQTALQRGYDLLKVKLGGPHDLETIHLIRELAPTATLRVDANAAWQVDEALQILPTLQTLGVEFVEEPLRLDSTEADYEKLFRYTPLPLMADERCHTLTDIPFCARYYHAINLKPTKTGGLREAYRMISAARSHHLNIMLGCFAETSVSITAFAQLSPLVDYADLDGGLLLANDPFDGVQFEGNQIRLPVRPGIGVIPKRLLD